LEYKFWLEASGPNYGQVCRYVVCLNVRRQVPLQFPFVSHTFLVLSPISGAKVAKSATLTSLLSSRFTNRSTRLKPHIDMCYLWRLGLKLGALQSKSHGKYWHWNYSFDARCLKLGFIC
jgi:hypothetical protein